MLLKIVKPCNVWERMRTRHQVNATQQTKANGIRQNLFLFFSALFCCSRRRGRGLRHARHFQFHILYAYVRVWAHISGCWLICHHSTKAGIIMCSQAKRRIPLKFILVPLSSVRLLCLFFSCLYLCEQKHTQTNKHADRTLFICSTTMIP